MLCLGQRPHHFDVYYSSHQQHCPGEIVDHSAKSSQSGNVWQIESVVQLQANCNYTVHIVSLNEAGATNSSGILSFSERVYTQLRMHEYIVSSIVYKYVHNILCLL